MGSCPEWFELIEAARYLAVPPWVLMEQPVCWREWALMSRAAMDALNAKKAKL